MAALPGGCSTIALMALAAALAAALLVIRHATFALRNHGAQRTRLIYVLAITADLENGYLFLAGGCSIFLDRWCGASVWPLERGLRLFAGPSCWTAASFEASLKTCLLAPVLGLIAEWLHCGDAGVLGGTVGLLRHAPAAVRLAALLSMLVAGASLWRALDALPMSAAIRIGGALLCAGSAGDLVAAMDPGSLPGHHVDDGSFLGSVALGSLALLSARLSGIRVLGLIAIGMAAVAVCGNGTPADLLPIAAIFATASIAERPRRPSLFWLWAWPVALLALSGLLVLETMLVTPGRGRAALALLAVMPLLAVLPVWCVWESARWLFGQMGRRDGPGPVAVALALLLAGATGSLLLTGVAKLAGFACVGQVCASPSDGWPLVITLPVLLPLLPAAANVCLATAAVGFRLIPDRRRSSLVQAIIRLRDGDRQALRRILAAFAMGSAVAAMVACATVLTAGIALTRIGLGVLASLP